MDPQKLQILCVEDNEEVSYLITDLLSSDEPKYDIICLPNPRQAYLLTEKVSFDLIILDYDLPEMTGAELCQLLRKKDKRTPIIFFSGLDHPDFREEAMAAGADAFLVKSADIGIFSETVKLLLEKRQVLKLVH